MKIIYSPRFKKSYKKLPARIKKIAEQKEAIFRKDPFDPRLKTHKLSGKLDGLLAFSIDQKYRILFEFGEDKNVIYFHQAGDHDIY
jgi:addiction module RelE/StbE family toxin